ncbi:hypothetical protein EGJ57_23555 [Brucella anthropi]|nr:hypothetical protein EGJ57_23555 [Brucella anthropi]
MDSNLPSEAGVRLPVKIRWHAKLLVQVIECGFLPGLFLQHFQGSLGGPLPDSSFSISAATFGLHIYTHEAEVHGIWNFDVG